MRNNQCVNMKHYLLSIVALLLSVAAFGQGSTTAAISGLIQDDAGQSLPGATIVATHQPTGTQYGTVSRVDGRYNLPAVRTGGPYVIRVSFVGYETKEAQGINLSLGQVLTANFTLATADEQLEEVVVVADLGDVFDANRTGASTNVSEEQIESLPTLSRSLQDFTRLTPQANGNSFVGANNRFNNITIDGAVNNDVFGLSGSGTPGGLAGTQPISLDAIKEIQVVLAPYDVTLGNFTGGGINAITRSGSNEFTGSAYFFGRNESFIGDDPETGAEAGEFTDNQYGVRIGGPIIKDKLFFFTNLDYARRTSPLLFNAGDANSVLTTTEAEDLSNYLITTYGYDPGSYSAQSVNTESNKWFGRLDWNITNNHQLTLRHNYIKAFDDNISRSNSFFRFGNNAYKFNNQTNSTVFELNSQFSNTLSNKLIVGYSRIRENRQTLGDLFPQVTINNVGSSNGTIEFGSQRSSVANELDQDIFEFTDNFKIYSGAHTFTIGTHNEFFKFRNLFINNFNGRWEFNSLDDFYNDVPARARTTYALDRSNPKPAAQFNAAQLGFYIQDEFAASDALKLTLGLRVDMPLIPDAPDRNLLFEQTFAGKRTDETPSGQLLFAPRLGFNYDLGGEQAIQLRGGTGIFTGRVPFVWLSNQFTNTGTLFGTIDVRNAAINNGNGFQPDPDLQYTIGTAGSTVEVNAIDKDFKIPQVWRSNVAVDFELPAGIIATVEGIYSKTLNNIKYQDINLKDANGTLADGFSNGADNRPTYPSDRRINPTFTNAVYLTNTNEGYTYSITGQLKKNFDNGIQSMIGYTYGKAKDINSGLSSTALSNWEFNQIVSNPNDPELAYSAFDLRHRIVANLGYKVEYGNNFGTSIGLFYAGKSGTPFTYLVFGDLNGDGNRNNDLLYIPANASEITFIDDTRNGFTAAEQQAAFQNYINNDDYLSANRGSYAERNGARTPWEHQFDLRLLQDIFVNVANTKNTLQLTLDIFNVGNLLNEDWGRSYFVSNQAVTILSTSRDGDGYNFNPNTPQEPWNTGFSSRWQGQIGIRYIFGN